MNSAAFFIACVFVANVMAYYAIIFIGSQSERLNRKLEKKIEEMESEPAFDFENKFKAGLSCAYDLACEVKDLSLRGQIHSHILTKVATFEQLDVVNKRIKALIQEGK